ncbi:carbohydrate ABC transporter permease [Kribbella sp. CA-294648]|uniref:carbohydrate ABC transporter permease n=1 Tax=Kribbella sp. CA-294648 TaxID=3239948 RepID=UPI003D8D1B40
MTILPLLVAVGLSFSKYDMLTNPTSVGWDNYTSLFSDPTFWTAIKNTLYFSLGQVPIGTITALAVAVLLNQRFSGVNGVRVAVYLPQAASFVVVSLVWTFMYDPQVGPLNQVIRGLGGDTVYWLTDSSLAMPSLIAMSIWRNLGYFMVIFLSALQSVPSSLLEAAAVDGANTWQRFRHVTLPALRPATTFVVITWFLGALQMFTQSYVMTGGGPVDATQTVVFRIYQEAFLNLNLGKASAIAVLLFIAVLVVAVPMRMYHAHSERRRR